MLERKQYSTEVGGKPLTLEVSELAGQANASVIGTYGNTKILVAAVMSKTDKPSIGYFPLYVSFEERFYAAGKILGSRFIRREGRPSDEAVLNGRLIDRSVRPLFDSNIRRDIQVIATVLQIDGENDPDFIGLLSASAALAISDIPCSGPIAGIRMAKMGDTTIINPTQKERQESLIDIFVSGTNDRLNMVEAGGHEASEDEAARLASIAHDEVKKLIELQRRMIKDIGKQKQEVKKYAASEEAARAAQKFLQDKIEAAIYTPHKKEMQDSVIALTDALKDHLGAEGFSEDDASLAHTLVEENVNALVHDNIIKHGRRPDGRKPDELRQLYAEVGTLNRMHGSGLFIRGNTQVLSVTTLAAPGQEQMVETMEISTKRRFMHHYNFPQYSVGETGPYRGPGRREIGHGALAEKALAPLIPDKIAFPYAIRIVSETLSSNGSSSMASVCAGSLSLMDAGVPIKKPAAGIAMGLMTQGEKYKILTDIQGPEDHHGDMDLKVAGTADGITAIQMDVKIEGVTVAMFREALEQAKKARLEILKTTDAILSNPRPELSPYAPRVFVLQIDPEKIGEVIGSGGKTINSIIEETGTTIDIEDDGTVYVTGENAEHAEKALTIIKEIVREYKVGEVVEGTIVKCMEFGAILEFGYKHDGMIHISEIAPRRVEKVEDYFKPGDKAKARIVKIDKEAGRIGLSTKEFQR